MLLTELMVDVPFTEASPQALSDCDVAGIQHDSRQVEPGDLFVAWRGERFDGRYFASQAISRGATAVLAWAPPAQEVEVPWLVVEKPRDWLSSLAVRLYGRPDLELRLVGITGTNGKTTVALLVQAILEASGEPAASIGTLGCRFGDRVESSERTTPEASDLLRTLRRLREAGACAVAMEVSSHALALGRVAVLRYDVAAFTNLSHDHLDQHADLEDYFNTKRTLFKQLKESGKIVVNADDVWGRRLLSELPNALSFGASGEVTAEELRVDLRGIHGRVKTPRGSVELKSVLVGSYNVENLQAAIAVAEALELPLEAIGRGIEKTPVVPGRLEAVDAGQDFPVWVDYAHTPDGLRAALESLRSMTERQIVVVFGCGGDRDRGKRPLMGKVASELADLVIVTDDNPRSEDPHEIHAAIVAGIKESAHANYRVIPDRRLAIERAIRVAASKRGWSVLVAGKGHEEGQIVGQEVRPFSDRRELYRVLEETLGSATH